jgi:hypothetical protein
VGLFGQCMLTATVVMVAIALTLTGASYVLAQDKSTPTSGGTQVAKAVGTIKSIQADSIVVASVQPSYRCKTCSLEIVCWFEVRRRPMVIPSLH